MKSHKTHIIGICSMYEHIYDIEYRALNHFVQKHDSRDAISP